MSTVVTVRIQRRARENYGIGGCHIVVTGQSIRLTWFVVNARYVVW